LRNGKAEAIALAAEPAGEAGPSAGELALAHTLLNQAGVRIMGFETGLAIGLWSDQDSAAIRNLVRIVWAGELPVRYPDGPGVPLRYKVRRVPGEPVPADVRLEMEASAEPWNVRNRMFRGFVSWLLPAEAKTSATTDPRTGIRPIAEWGPSCGRGFVSDSRFGANQPAIRRTNRANKRAWRKLNDR
jgi:hypothetical protein